MRFGEAARGTVTRGERCRHPDVGVSSIEVCYLLYSADDAFRHNPATRPDIWN
jgi:hypothetical protein